MLADANSIDKALDFLTQAAQMGMRVRNNYDWETIAIFDPIPMAVMKVADRERGQLLVEAPSKVAMRQFLKIWIQELQKIKTSVHWVMEVDPVDV